MHTTNNSALIEGSITRVVLRMAWPIAASMFLEFALAITDFFWIGKLGAIEQDAMTSCMIVVWTAFSVVQMVTIGVNAIVSRHFGSGEIDQAGYAGAQGMKGGAVIGIIFGLTGYFSADAILAFMKTEPEVAVHGVAYLKILFMTTPLFFFVETLSAIFRASGDSRTPMIVSGLGVGLNMILDPIFIFGWGPAPELGMAGAAWGTLVSMALTVMLFTVFVKSDKLACSLKECLKPRIDLSVFFKTIKIGLPMTTMYLVFVGVYMIVIQVVHQFGHVAGAAMGIGNRLESINFLGSTALALAVSAIIGQNLGANRPERASRAAWVTTGIGVGVALVTTIIFVLIPEKLAGIFTDDPEVIRVASDYVIILGLSQTFMAVEIILEGAFSGAGDTVPPMLISIPGSLVRIPLAYYLAIPYGMGINGVWWTFTITTFAKGLLMIYWFSRNRWQTKKL